MTPLLLDICVRVEKFQQLPADNFDAKLADAIGLHLELSQRALVLTSQRAAVLDELDQYLSPGSIPSNAEGRQRA